jgi:betaine reductase
MDPENQGRIKTTVDRYGSDDMVVVLGAADPDGLEMVAETVTEGDPAFVGPLAGVQLGLPVVHIFEDDVKAQVDPAIFEERIGFVEMAVDSEAVKVAMRKIRRET